MDIRNNYFKNELINNIEENSIKINNDVNILKKLININSYGIKKRQKSKRQKPKTKRRKPKSKRRKSKSKRKPKTKRR